MIETIAPQPITVRRGGWRISLPWKRSIGRAIEGWRNMRARRRFTSAVISLQRRAWRILPGQGSGAADMNIRAEW